MTSETLAHVRLRAKDQEFLGEMVSKGYFSSKSDVLRTALHLFQYSELCEQIKQGNPKPKPLKEVMSELKVIRREVYKYMFEPAKPIP